MTNDTEQVRDTIMVRYLNSGAGSTVEQVVRLSNLPRARVLAALLCEGPSAGFVVSEGLYTPTLSHMRDYLHRVQSEFVRASVRTQETNQ